MRPTAATCVTLCPSLMAARRTRRATPLASSYEVSEPLFLYYAFHVLHIPLQVLLSYLDRIHRLVAQKGGEPFDTDNRKLYHTMVFYMEEDVGKLLSARKDKGMWESTLFLFMSDNGLLYEPGAANKHPLKGGEYNGFEGGIPTIAFASGGFVPAEKRGTRFEGVISIADWYGTLAEIASVGAEGTRAAQANAWLAKHSPPQLAPV